MTGTFQGFDLAFGSFGQQYTAIDGQRYVTWFDLADKDLAGLAQLESKAPEQRASYWCRSSWRCS